MHEELNFFSAHCDCDWWTHCTSLRRIDVGKTWPCWCCQRINVWHDKGSNASHRRMQELSRCYDLYSRRQQNGKQAINRDNFYARRISVVLSMYITDQTPCNNNTLQLYQPFNTLLIELIFCDVTLNCAT